MSDGLYIVIARSRVMLVKRQTSIEHDLQHFDIIGYWQMNSCHGHR